MSVRGRVSALERQGGQLLPLIVIVWDGREEGVWRDRFEEAKRRGHPISVVNVQVAGHAEGLPEAEALIQEHRERNQGVALTVYRSGTRGAEVLAGWDPGLPEWLRNLEE